MVRRPLADRSMKDLTRMVRQRDDDAEALQEIHNELCKRYTYDARGLRQRVADRLDVLGRGAAVATAPHAGANAEAATESVGEPAAFGIRGPEDLKLIQVVERMRERLLDLSGRNPLLNYRHPRTRSVRIIDEVPAQAFERLLTQSGGMTFAPLDAPDTAQLRDSGEAEPLEGSAADEPAEEVTRRRHREERRAKQAILEARRRAVAQRMGLTPSFDLPATVQADTAQHSDSRLQTLLFPPELEKLLHTLQRDSVTAIQESGANVLHLMFGFVEWRDVNTGEGESQTRLAPLVLLPVSLTRTELDLRTRTYRYRVEPTGEDWDTNITLQVKCKKDFGFEIPAIDREEDDSLEAYFGRVEGKLGSADGWKLRRHVTLGLVSFGKILMWRDLDPTTWPADAPLLGNRVLREILGEIDAETSVSDPIVEPYRIDDLASDLAPAPALVTDADSSQHSVLIDVQQGKNLVVQGPPGTGKSQTIANLIGHALLLGKKVLFVAEKKAALEVVHKRLEDAELGPFCLALHSHTSQKREFLDGLAGRLSSRGNTRRPRDGGQVRAMAEQARNALNQHVARLHTPFSALERTPYEIFWRARRCAADLGESVTRAIRDRHVPGAEAMDATDISRNRVVLDRFAAEAKVVRAQGCDLVRHPWAGVCADSLDYDTIERLLDLARVWQTNLDALGQEKVEFEASVGCVLPTTPRSLREVLEAVRSVPEPHPAIPPDLPRAIAGASDEPLVREATAAVEEARQEWDAVPGQWGQRGVLEREAADPCERVLEDASSVFGGPLGQAEAAALRLRLLEAVDSSDRAMRLVTRMATAAHLDLPVTATVAQRLAAVVDSFSAVDDSTLALRSPALAMPGVAARIEELTLRAQELRSDARGLDETYDSALRPDATRLRAHIVALSTAPRLLPWLFSGKYRSAVAAYRSMTGRRAKRSEMEAGLRSLLAHTTAVTKFESDPVLSELFGAGAEGLQTDFERARVLLRWRSHVAGLCRGLNEDGRTLEASLWSGSILDWREAEALLRADPDAAAACRSITPALEGIGSSLSGGALADRDRSLATVREELTAAADLLHGVASAFDSAGVTEPGVSVADLRGRLALLRKAWAAEDAIGRYEELFAALGLPFEGIDTNTGAVLHSLGFLAGIREAQLPSELARWMIESDPAHRLAGLKRRSAALAGRLVTETEARDAFCRSGDVDQGAWLAADTSGSADSGLDDTDLIALSARVGRALESPEALHGWAAYRARRADAVRVGLEPFCALIEADAVPAESASTAYEAAVYRTLSEAVLRTDPELAAFSGAAHEQTRNAFWQYDKRLIQSVRAEIAHQLDQTPPRPGVSYGRVAHLTDEALIRHESEKSRKHIAIREMFRRAGSAIVALKPCFLMGPQAVAQYLSAGLFEFDLVVMDEASQMRPEDALGAIARGKQLVVVGDPKQLGPTRFFDRIQDDEEDIEDVSTPFGQRASEVKELDDTDATLRGPSVLERSESILHAAAARYPTRLLRWHYRSKHPKLIAFSNREFYGDNLILFPTPGGTDAFDGVFFHAIDEGLYESRGRRNVPEARAVVEAVREHARTHPDRSLLVATLNAVQAELIDLLIEEAEKDDVDLEAFRKRHEGTLEPLAVKNLENVQGDERDAIMVSVTFGRTADGRLLQRFGPINATGGERRLNVLFTRAKHRLDVFCSFNPADLRVSPDSPRGLQVFRDYLVYAEDADWAHGRETGRAPDSDFEIAVAAALEARGYTVRCQIGIAGYFIDLGVLHPDHPGRFILGVECDGASYHSSRSARDRDRLREQVLTHEYGWKIHRVWSTDWFRNPVEQTDRIVHVLDRLLQAERDHRPVPT